MSAVPRKPADPKASKLVSPRVQVHDGTVHRKSSSKDGEKQVQFSTPLEQPGVASGTLGQSVKSGDTRLLLCTDSEDGTPGQGVDAPLQIVIPKLDLSTTETIAPAHVVPAQPEIDAALPKKSAPVANSPRKSKRKMSRAEQFSEFEKVMPGVKLDRAQRRTVMHTLVDMNIWQEGEEDSESSDETMHDSKSHKKGRHRGKLGHGSKTSSSRPSASVASPTPAAKSSSESMSSPNSVQPMSPLPSESSSMLLSPGKSVQTALSASPLQSPAGNSTSGPQDLQDSSTPFQSSRRSLRDTVRQKIMLFRPKQIPASDKLQQLNDKKSQNRESVRDVNVQKAVQFLVKLNIRMETEESAAAGAAAAASASVMMNPTSSSNAGKSMKEIKAAAVRRVSFGLVDKILKRSKVGFASAVDAFKIAEAKYKRAKIKSGKFLLKAWRRYCDRVDVRRILAIGRAGIELKRTAEFVEHNHFRMRVANRRYVEDNAIRFVKQVRAIEVAGVPVKGKTIVPVAKIKFNSDGVALSDADEKLFAKDFEHLRPDLAPFSTRINSMITASMTQIKASFDKQRAEESRLLSQMISAPSSPRGGIEKSHSIRSSVSTRASFGRDASFAMASPGGVGLAKSSSLRIAEDPPQLTIPRAIAAKMRPQEIADALITTDVPLRSPSRVNSTQRSVVGGWESMARLDGVPTLEEVKKDERYKSPAYRVLAKLCGLSEEDIQRQKLEQIRRPQFHGII